MESTAIVNPDNGKVVVTKRQIQEVTLKYCKETLSNNNIGFEYEEIMDTKRKEMKSRLAELGGDFIPTIETFEALVHKFKKSGKKNYDFLVKSSKKFQNIVFKFAQLMIEKEVFPSSFQETTLHMIFKGGKGRRQNLPDNRFVHSKFWFPRMVEGLVVVQGLKEPLVEGSTMNQIGGQPGHRAEELIFSLKSIVAKYRSEGKQIIIQSSDISK